MSFHSFYSREQKSKFTVFSPYLNSKSFKFINREFAQGWDLQRPIIHGKSNDIVLNEWANNKNSIKKADNINGTLLKWIVTQPTMS